MQRQPSDAAMMMVTLLYAMECVDNGGATARAAKNLADAADASDSLFCTFRVQTRQMQRQP